MLVLNSYCRCHTRVSPQYQGCDLRPLGWSCEHFLSWSAVWGGGYPYPLKQPFWTNWKGETESRMVVLWHFEHISGMVVYWTKTIFTIRYQPISSNIQRLTSKTCGLRVVNQNDSDDLRLRRWEVPCPIDNVRSFSGQVGKPRHAWAHWIYIHPWLVSGSLCLVVSGFVSTDLFIFILPMDSNSITYYSFFFFFLNFGVCKTAKLSLNFTQVQYATEQATFRLSNQNHATKYTNQSWPHAEKNPSKNLLLALKKPKKTAGSTQVMDWPGMLLGTGAWRWGWQGPGGSGESIRFSVFTYCF